MLAKRKIVRLQAKIKRIRELYYATPRFLSSTAEKRIAVQMRFIYKSADYAQSWNGHAIFRSWYLDKGFTHSHASVIVLASYYKHFRMRDHKYWNMDINRFYEACRDLIDAGYLLVSKMPGKGVKPVNIYMLSPKGEALEAEYEAHFKIFMSEFSKKKDGSDIKFEDNIYFRRKNAGKYYIPVVIDKRYTKNVKT